MAEVLLSAVLEQLVSFGVQQAEQEVRLLLGVDVEIGSLERTFNILKGLLEDAEEKQTSSNTVKAWLEDVKDIVYRTEDVLDECRTKLLVGTANTESSINTKNNKQVLSCLSCFFSCFQQVNVRHNIGHKIKDIQQLLDENVRHSKYLELIRKEPKHRQEDLHLERLTTSFIDVSKIFGRDGDKDVIMKWLLNESNQQQLPLDITSIVGTGGFGKTALAQLVFNQKDVEIAFDSRIWICVSEPVDQQRIAKEIIEQITKDKPKVDGLEALLQLLRDFVKGKRFLLILDDVWPKRLQKWWDQLKNPLCSGASGSKIILTTRSKEVATTMHSNYTLNVEQLSDDDCWLLFEEIAFFEILACDRCQFETIGRKIAKKCKGVPLAIKTIASLMQNKQTIQEWQSVLDNNVWEDVRENLSPALLLSYYDLPSYLKQCFMYCAVIPKDKVMEKERLVKLWMAQGFLGSDGGKELEMIGESYFNELARRSFFQDFEINDLGNVDSCKMHDLVHDFAQSLTMAECCVIEKNEKKTCGSKVRHLAVPDLENLSISRVNKNLRTLIQSSLTTHYYPDISKVKKNLRELTCLRTLDLSGLMVKKLPKEVELLLHLRYLDVSNTLLRKLPKTVCKLCNLQTLKLNNCDELRKLPDGIRELSNMRHFELKCEFERHLIKHYPKGIGRLSHLRTLTKFVVSGETGGCGIEELGNLIKLRGFLRIENLCQVDNMLEAKKAGLLKKENLDELALDFHGRAFISDEDREKMESVLKGLQPYNSLKKLLIEHYPGKKISFEIIPGLRSLSLFDCPNLKALPALCELQFLESLDIRRVGKEMKNVSVELLKISGSRSSSQTSLKLFPTLKTLSLGGFLEWEEGDKKIEEETIHKSIMPRLHSLRIYECPKLKVVPHYMFSQTLRELDIWDCPRLSGMQPCLPPLLETLFFWGDVGVLSSSLMPIIHNNTNSYPNLKCVAIKNTQISSLPQGLTQFMSLQKLKLSFCEFLDFKPEEEFKHLNSLPTLTIYIAGCPLLTERRSRENWRNLSNFPKII